MPNLNKPRIVCQFSCGAASAVATKLAIAKYKQVEIINAFLVEEHPDNRRFLKDCEKWFGQSVTVLRDEKYDASAYEVFKREKFIKSANGAPCSVRLKRKVLDKWKHPGDVMVLGFTIEEKQRFDEFVIRNPDKPILAPLIENHLSKPDCLAMLERAGIEIPEMYKLGFHNANCIGCPKGGKGYWNHIRKIFPDTFQKMSDLEQEIGETAFLFYDNKTEKRTSLKDLLPDAGRHDDEPDISCSFYCQIAEKAFSE